jgi:hypothetical protein
MVVISSSSSSGSSAIVCKSPSISLSASGDLSIAQLLRIPTEDTKQQNNLNVPETPSISEPPSPLPPALLPSSSKSPSSSPTQAPAASTSDLYSSASIELKSSSAGSVELYHSHSLSVPVPTELYSSQSLSVPVPTELYSSQSLSVPVPTELYSSQSVSVPVVLPNTIPSASAQNTLCLDTDPNDLNSENLEDWRRVFDLAQKNVYDSLNNDSFLRFQNFQQQQQPQLSRGGRPTTAATTSKDGQLFQRIQISN